MKSYDRICNGCKAHILTGSPEVPFNWVDFSHGTGTFSFCSIVCFERWYADVFSKESKFYKENINLSRENRDA